MTKSVLEGEGIEFKAINIEGDKDHEKEAYDYIVNQLGYRSMPVVIKEGHDHILGFNPDKLKELKG
jgi:glutaredoxin-like protein NrdH